MLGLRGDLLRGSRLTDRLLGLGLPYRHRLWEDLFGEALEEPCSGTLPHLSLLNADFAEPHGMRAVTGGFHPTLGADILLTVLTHHTGGTQHPQLFSTQDAAVHPVPGHVLPHVLQTVHQAPDSLLFHLFHLLSSSDHSVDDFLLLICQLFLLPLSVGLTAGMDGPACLELFFII